MFERQAQVTTAKAQHYLYQLCKHFSHKITAQWDEQFGTLDFGIGQCRLHAEEATLLVYCEAQDVDNLHEVMDVIKRHFDRFAHKEACELVWSP